ncbi:uncharacterized protein LOC123274567 [Cotesia glomerata]|nr:uncharacterized protein LOC123274567 [Cotesia glomerata]
MITLWRLMQIKDYKYLHQGLTKIRAKIQKSNTRGMKVDYMNPKEISEKAEKSLRLRDQVSKDYTLIYKTSIKTSIYLCYHGTYMIIASCLYGLYHTIFRHEEIEFLKSSESEGTMGSFTIYDQSEVILSYSGLILLNGFLFLICRRHVLRIWRYNKDNDCILILPTFFPNQCRKVVFKAGTASQKYPRAVNDITRAPHVINGKTYHINDYNFRRPADYNKVMFNFKN